MNLLLFLYYEFLFYWPWWICFVVISFCLARYLGRPGRLLSCFLIAGLIVCVEANSVFHDMRVRPELGRDVDGAFLFGVVFRVGFYSFLLWPFRALGGRLRDRNYWAIRDNDTVA